MFFIGIFGIGQRQNELEFQQTRICSGCGRFGRIQLFYCYTYFHFFFIPLFRWNKHYVVKMSCCNTLFECEPSVGGAILKGERPEITEKDLKRIDGMSGSSLCQDCGFELSQNYSYCPKCGRKL